MLGLVCRPESSRRCGAKPSHLEGRNSTFPLITKIRIGRGRTVSNLPQPIPRGRGGGSRPSCRRIYSPPPFSFSSLGHIGARSTPALVPVCPQRIGGRARHDGCSRQSQVAACTVNKGMSSRARRASAVRNITAWAGFGMPSLLEFGCTTSAIETALTGERGWPACPKVGPPARRPHPPRHQWTPPPVRCARLARPLRRCPEP